MGRISKELKLNSLQRGFDAPAFKDSAKYYLVGSEWKKVSDKPIPTASLHYWQYECSKSSDFVGLSVDIDLEVVKAEVDKQWPGVWTGPFRDGSRGKRFWDPTADNDTASVVRPNGMQCFTGPQAFVSWSEVLGAQFVSQFEIGRIGKAIEKCWYDGRSYYLREENGDLTETDKDDIKLILRCQHSISTRRGRGEETSELDRAMYQINREKRVDSALPFVYNKKHVVERDGRRYLNTSRIKLANPSGQSSEWGKGFPHIAEWMETMFGEEQLPYEQAWLAYAYANAYAGKPRRGHAQFLVGPPNSGKTFYNTFLLAKLFGGHIKASEFLIGKTDFNSHLFEYGLWTVDDEAPSARASTHISFTSKIKEFVANPEFLCNTKFKKAVRIEWDGRLSITLNDDTVSLRLMPDMDMSIRDKLMVFKCHQFKKFDLGFRKRAEAEIPHFAQWLIDYETPKELAELRFGVKAYINPEISDMLSSDGRYSHIQELLDVFRKNYFEEDGEEQQVELTCSELLLKLSRMANYSVLLRDVNTKSLGWGLRHLASKGHPWLFRSDAKGKNRWIIKNL